MPWNALEKSRGNPHSEGLENDIGSLVKFVGETHTARAWGIRGEDPHIEDLGNSRGKPHSEGLGNSRGNPHSEPLENNIGNLGEFRGKPHSEGLGNSGGETTR